MSTSYREIMPAETPIDRIPDEELLTRVAAGDSVAFAELFRRHQSRVFRFALHMTGSLSTADDVVQDVFLIVMSDAARYQPSRAAVTAWLCGIARNRVRQRIEQDRRLAPIELGGDHDHAPAGSGPADPLAGMLRDEQIESLRRAVQTLPVAYREALVLCDLQEMSYEDAAQTLECPVGTVRSRLHRARAMLASKVLAAGWQEPTSRSVAPTGVRSTDQAEYGRRVRKGEVEPGGCFI